MAINFPGSPSVNQIFSDPTSGFTYQWNGTVWVNYNYTAPAKIQELDDITTGTMTATNSAGDSIIALHSDKGDITLGDFNADIEGLREALRAYFGDRIAPRE